MTKLCTVQRATCEMQHATRGMPTVWRAQSAVPFVLKTHAAGRTARCRIPHAALHAESAQPDLLEEHTLPPDRLLLHCDVNLRVLQRR